MCCLQIHDEAKKFAYQTGIRVVVAYGGAPVHNQVIAQIYVSLLTTKKEWMELSTLTYFTTTHTNLSLDEPSVHFED